MKTKSASLRNIKNALESQIPVTIKHHIIGAMQIDDAKLLGFGTKSVMVRVHRSNGWSVIDPITWEIV